MWAMKVRALEKWGIFNKRCLENNVRIYFYAPNHYVKNKYVYFVIIGYIEGSEKNKVDPNKPYAYLIEKEQTSTGSIEDVGTIFLTNKECPYTCLMCDLWKNTTDFQVPAGAIPEQMELALSHMPDVRHLKLYNSGNFFDIQAIPPEDYQDIASLLHGFETVIVESHPKLVTEKCLSFRDMLKPYLSSST